MADVWPVSLPQEPLFEGNIEQAPNVTLRTQMDDGPPKMRQRSTAGYYKCTYVFNMTTAQVATLLTFYNTTVEGGAVYWEWTHPRTSSTENWRFTAPPSYTKITSGYWKVTIQVEQLP